MTDPGPTTQLTRTERLDRLPFTRTHGKLLGASGVGWALDAMDVGLISFIMAALGAEWALSDTEKSWIGSIGFVGMAIGASVGGLLADRFGRRQVFALTLLVYGLATGVSAASVGLAMLLALRFVVGLGLGAELPVASTLMSEFAPRRIRGRVVVILEAFWALGWIAAALIGYLVVPQESGWRWALLIGTLPAVYALVVRWRMPESVRFLERAGRTEEAEAVVQRFESSPEIARRSGHSGQPDRRAISPGEGASPGEAPGAGDGAASVPLAGAPEQRVGWRDLWQPRLRRRTTAIWLAWFGVNFAYYGAFIWLPSLLVAKGFDLVHSFGYTLIITLAQLPGYAAAAFLIERWGRRATLATFLAGSAVAAVWFGQADSVGMIIAAGMTLSAFNLGAWGALYAVTPELYPTTLRGTGSGSAAAFGRIASILAPLSVPLLLGVGGTGFAFVVFAIAFALACGAALALPELSGRALEER